MKSRTKKLTSKRGKATMEAVEPVQTAAFEADVVEETTELAIMPTAEPEEGEAGCSSDPFQPVQVGSRSKLYWNRNCKARYVEDIQRRTIIVSKIVDLDSFAVMGIDRMLEAAGLAGLCRMRGSYCERVIRLFYANLRISTQPLEVHTYIFGHEVRFTANDLNIMLGCVLEEPSDEYYQMARAPPFVKQGRGLEVLRLLHQDPEVAEYSKPKGKELNALARLIHLIMTYTILPRLGHRELVTSMDLYMLEKVFMGQKVDIGYIIMSHMQEVVNNSAKALPYNWLIQSIVEQLGVPIPETEPRIEESVTDIYNNSLVDRMGITQTGGQWMRPSKKDATHPPQSAPMHSVPFHEQPPPPPPQASHFSSMPDETVAWMSRMEELHQMSMTQMQRMQEQLQMQQSQIQEVAKVADDRWAIAQQWHNQYGEWHREMVAARNPGERRAPHYASASSSSDAPDTTFRFNPVGSSQPIPPAVPLEPPPLKTVRVAHDLMSRFKDYCHGNIRKNIETCAILAGKLIDNEYVVSEIIFPDQKGTSDTCYAVDGADVAVFRHQQENGLLTVGWIHTHPKHDCFMSSVDLHQQYGYQKLLPESISIIVAPTDKKRPFGVLRCTPAGMEVIGKCKIKEQFHLHEPPDFQYEGPLFDRADRVFLDPHLSFLITDLRSKPTRKKKA